tara:strand:+ start:154 stop:840 length:687 start_codon:yes stop_codon:yes gene_type:complete
MSANNQELCYENDEINRKWAEDNERNGDIMAEQQEQIKRLEEEIELKKIHIKKLKSIKCVYHPDVWSPVEILRILDDYDLNWNEAVSKVQKLKDENKKLKEECGAMDIINKLNKEFDDLQNLNQKFVEEIELKAETIKEQKLELEIVSRFADYVRFHSNVLTSAFWFKDNGDWLAKKGIITKDEDFDRKTDELAEQDIDITEELQILTYNMGDEFCDYVRENITSNYF